MKGNSLYRFGGACSMLLGLSYLAVGLTTLLTPPELTYANNVQSPFMYFEANKAILLANYWSFALVGFFGLGVVPAVSAMVMHLDEGWVRWTSTLASLGFAVTILDNYWSIVVTPSQAAAYITGDAARRAALTIPGGAQFIDVQGWLGYGAVGAWILVVSLLALRGGVWPKGLAYLGMAAAFVYLLALLSMVLPNWRVLSQGVGAVAIALGPALFIWLGLVLRGIGSERQPALAYQAD